MAEEIEVKRLVNEHYLFLDLLAVIHGDGGHHTEAVGIRKSFEDALIEIYRLRAVE